MILYHSSFYSTIQHSNGVPPLLPRPRCTRLACSSHPYSVHLSNARVNQYSQSFIPFSGKLWNSLPASVFPPAYDLNCFKREVSRHLSHSSFGYWIWTFQELALQWALLFYFCCPWPLLFYIYIYIKNLEIPSVSLLLFLMGNAQPGPPFVLPCPLPPQSPEPAQLVQYSVQHCISQLSNTVVKFISQLSNTVERFLSMSFQID